MIIVQLIGGLGNQLFQYAVGRHVALRSGQDLKLDVLGFERYKVHKYSLAEFGIVQQFASAAEVARLRPTRFQKLVRRARVYRQGSARFDSTVLDLRGDWYLEGYWQSERFFKEIADVIRREFTVTAPLEGEDLAIAHAMSEGESVAVHVRRGDYVTNAAANRTHGTCSPEYYRAACSFLGSRLNGDLKLFVFSDDLEWARRELDLPERVTFVGHNDASRNYQDLRLMSLARHNIIANSSFSWWGAWLNANPSKIVCAPRRWAADETVDTHDMVPPPWQRIDSV